MPKDAVSNQAASRSDPGAVDDARVVAHAQQGDLDAFDVLVRRHQGAVFAVAIRMLGDRGEAEEIAQEAFVRAFQSLRGFRQEAKLSTWLISITMNLCRNRRRWWARRRHVIAGSLDDPLETGEESVAHQTADPAPDAATIAEARERQQIVAQALEQLDATSRAVIVLRDLQGMAYEEIAEALGVPLGTVKSRINRARLQLRALLDGKLE